MAELDPVTGLPINRASSSDMANSLRKINQHDAGSFISSPVHGTRGDYGSTPVTSDRSLDEYRAQSQSGMEILGKTAATAIGGIVAGGLVSAVGFMADLPQYVGNFIADLPGDLRDGVNREGRRGQQFERNKLSEWGHAIENYFFDNFEVYQTERAQNGGLHFGKEGRLRDATFWGANAPSILSSVTLMVPAWGTSTAIRALSRLGNLNRTAAGARAVQATDVITSAFVSRHNYNMMEGYELMDRRTEKYIEDGRSYTEAKELASQDASRFYTTGYANMWKDVLQWGVLLRGTGYASRAATQNLGRQLEGTTSQLGKQIAEQIKRGRSVSEIVKQTPGARQFLKTSFLTQAPLEVVEEFNIQFQKNWSARNADIMLGLEEGEVTSFLESYFSGDFMDELQNPETQNAALMAFLGGPAIQGLGKVATFRDRQRALVAAEQQAQNFNNQINHIQEKFKQIEDFTLAGNDVAALRAEHELVTNLVISGLMDSEGGFHGAVQNSSLHETKAMFEAIKNLSAEELQSVGLSEDAVSRAEWVLNEISQVEEIYNKNINRDYSTEINDVIAAYMTEQEYMNDKTTERLGIVGEKIDSVLTDSSIEASIKANQIDDVSNVKRDSRLYALRQLKGRLSAEFQKKLRQSTGNVLRHQMISRRHEETMSWITNEIEQLSQDQKDNPTSDAGKALIAEHLKKHSSWNNLHLQGVTEEITLREGEADLAEYGTPQFEQEYLNARNLSNEKLSDRINSFFYKEYTEDGNLVRHDNKLYAVEHTEEGTKLKEYDPEASAFTGEELMMTPEIFEESVVGKPSFKQEDLLSVDQKDETVKELEKSLKNREYGKYLEGIARLWISGFSKEASQARTKLVADFTSLISESNDVNEITKISSTLQQYIADDSLVERIQKATNDRIKEIDKKFKEELKALEKAMAPEKKAVRKLERDLTNITNDINSLEESFVNYDSSDKKSNISFRVEKLISERDQFLEASTEEQQAQIRQEYATKIEAEISSIIAEKSESSQLAEKLLQDYKNKKDSLIQTKDQLEAAIKQYEKTLAVYERVKEKYKEFYNISTDITALVVTENEIRELFKDFDQDVLHALFETDISTTVEFTDKLNDALDSADKAVETINAFIKGLESTVKINDFIRDAMVNSYKRLMADGISNILSDTVSTDLLNTYKKYLNQELTKGKPAENFSPRELSQLNRYRSFIQAQDEYSVIEFRDVAHSEVLDILKGEIESFKQSHAQRVGDIVEAFSNIGDELNILLEFQQRLMKYKYIKKDPTKTTPFEPPLKLLESVFITTTGDTIQSESQARYTRFVNNINVYKTPVHLQIVRPEQFDIPISDDVRSHYGEDIFYMVAVKQNEDGTLEYYNEDGSTSPEFNLDNSIYTSFPDVNTEVKYLGKNSKPQLEQRYRDAHQQWVDSIKEQLANGETITVGVTEKSRGVPANSVKDYHNAKSFKDIIKELVTLYHSYDGTNVVDGVTIRTPKGSVFAIGSETGNMYEVINRQLTKAESDTIVEFLKGYAENVIIGKHGKPLYGVENFSLETEVGPITVKDFIDIKRQFTSGVMVDVNFGKNQIVINGLPISILAKDAEGNLTNKLADLTTLREVLSLALTDINSAYLNSGESIKPTRFQDGKWTTKPAINYANFALENLARTPIAKAEANIITREGAPTKNPMLHNQQFRFEHPHIPQEGLSEKVKPKKKPVEEGVESIISDKDYKRYISTGELSKDLFTEIVKRKILEKPLSKNDSRIYNTVVKNMEKDEFIAMVEDITKQIEKDSDVTKELDVAEIAKIDQSEIIQETETPVEEGISNEEKLAKAKEKLDKIKGLDTTKDTEKKTPPDAPKRRSRPSPPSAITQRRNVPDVKLREKYFNDNDTQKSSVVLSKIAESNHPLAPLAKQLSNFIVEDFDITLKPTLKLRDREVAGLFTIHNEILLNEGSTFRGRGSEPTILHEIIHGLTERQLQNIHAQSTQDLVRLFKYANENLSEDHYGLTDPSEFVAELFTNAEFVQALKEIAPTDNVREYSNLFEQILDYILELFGITTKQESLYSQAFAVASHIIHENQQSELAFADSWFVQDRASETSSKVETIDRYNNKVLKDNPDKIFIFGDNSVQRGKGGQAIIRGQENAFGIPTKKLPSMSEKAFYSDSELENNKKEINEAIEKIKTDGRPVVFPKDGIGTGLAKLKEKAPQTYDYLNTKLLNEFGFNNETGEIVSQKPVGQPERKPFKIQLYKDRPHVSLNSNSTLLHKDARFTDSALKYFNDSFFHILNTEFPNRIVDLFDGSNQANVELYENIILRVHEDIVAHRDDVLSKTEEAINKGDGDLANKYVGAYENITFLLEGYGEYNNSTINAFDRLIQLHQDYLRQFGLEAINTQENLNVEGESRDSAELWHIESLKYSFKDTASSSTKMLFQAVVNEESQSLNEDFMIYEHVDSGKLFSIVGNLLASSSDSDMIIQRLKENKDSINGLDQIVEKISIDKSTVEMSKGEFDKLVQFLQSFSKHENKYYFTEVGQNGKLKFIDGVVNTRQRQKISDWQSRSNLKGTKISPILGVKPMKISEGQLVYDNDQFSELFGKGSTFNFTKGLEKVSTDNFTQEQKEYLSGITNPAFAKRYENYFKYNTLLSELFGIEIITNVLPDKSYYNAIESIVRGISNGLSDRNILGRETDFTNYFKPIMDHEINNVENPVDTNYFNFENETQHVLQYNSFLTHTENNINNSDTRQDLFQKSRHLASDYSSGDVGGSLLLNKMLFDQEGNRINTIEMKFMEGLKDDSSGESFNKLSMNDKVSFSFSGSIMNVHAIFRASDNSLERVFDKLNFFDYLTDNDYQNLFADYLQNEINFFKDLNEGEEYRGLRGLSHEHSMFGEIIEKGNLVTLYNSVLEGDGKLPVNFRQQFKASMESYISEKTQEALLFAEDMMLVAKEKEMYKNYGLIGLSKENVESFTEKQLLNVLKRALINRAIWNVEQSKVFTGHPAAYASADNFYKRMGMMVSTKDTPLTTPDLLRGFDKHYPRKFSKRNYWVDGEYKNQIPKKGDNFELVYKVLLFDDHMVQSEALSKIKKLGVKDDSAYANMTETDAIGLMHLDSYRDLMLTSSKWSDSYEKLYQWVTKGEADSITYVYGDGSTEVITERSHIRNSDGSITKFNSIKPQAFGATPDSRFIPEGYKLSVLPILPEVVDSHPNMKRVYDYMTSQNADILTFPSANKFGTKAKDGTLPKLYNDKGEAQPDQGLVQYSFAKNWGIQLETGKSTKVDQGITGTQAPKIMLHNVYDKGMSTSSALQNAVDTFKQYKKALIDHELGKLKEVFDLTNPEDINKIVKVLLEETFRRNPTKNVVDALESLPDDFERGFGVDILPNRDKIEQILAAIANDRIIRNPVRGSMYVQAPSTLWENDVRRYSDDKTQALSNDLRFDAGEGTIEVYMPHSFKEFIGDELSIDAVPQELLRTVGFRIPTSGMNSIESIIIKRFLPDTYGDVIILPSEIVAKAGSDFDVDKLSVFLANYTIPKIPLNDAMNFLWNELQGENPKQTLLNIYDFLEDADGIEGVHISYPEDFNWKKVKIEDVKQDLKQAMTEVKSNIYDKLIKDDTDIAKKFTEQYSIDTPRGLQYIEPGFESREAMENGLIDSMLEVIKHADRANHISPIGISLFEEADSQITPRLSDAVGKGSNTMLTFDLVYQELVKERNSTSKNLIGVEALQIVDHGFSQEYNYLMPEDSNIYFEDGSYYVEGDNISLGGVFDTEGSNLITEVLNQSANASVDGANNPILFNLNFNFETTPVINYLVRAGVPFDKIMLFINQPAIRDYAKLEMIRKSKSNKVNNFLTADGVTANIAEKYGKKTTNDIVTWEQMQEELGSDGDSAYQRKLVNDYKHYKESAQLITDYITASRIDSDLAKNTSAIDLKVAAVERIIRNPDIINSDKVFTEGYLAPYYNALKGVQEVYSPLFTHYKFENSSYGRAYKDMVGMMLSNKFKFTPLVEKVKILDNFKSDFISSILINNPITIADGKFYGVLSERIESLMTGENSIAKQLLDYKEKSTNLIVEDLSPIIGHSFIDFKGKKVKIDNIKMFNQKIPIDESNRYTDAWRDLFRENLPLAKDLVAVTILQSGLKLSPMTFTKLIPAEVYRDMFLSAFDHTDANINVVSPDHFLQQFFVNNYRNENLVPTAYYKMTRHGLKLMSGDNFIYKVYEYKDEYKALSREGKKQWDDTKKSNKKSTPTIYVNRNNDRKAFNIFNTDQFSETGTFKIHLNGIQDYGNSQSLLGYFDPIVASRFDNPLQGQEDYKKRVNETEHLETINQILRC
jgi:hypothetical protein